ncbi:trehalose-6-phosphate synthase [Comamonas piscis]|uniref:Trehalose-6-phosphate synthase n=1 Tax=Comamonas piscis TaxID=1562974 RepID=A0A7G5EH83_9BURK|nr:trehalose-6-phosphate synthase [Comamonas piscis]QMV73358.1 trehalose-6-phosphate synthase [Comamonas piscis]WSO36161.1 trehalose-6-phosphate synthase [Comamonas piscis]
MSRLVVVSNRVADPRDAAPGGLAIALEEALQRQGGLWFGWGGQVTEQPNPPLSLRQWGAVTVATTHLQACDHDSYYSGFCNKVLWPVFHNRLDLAEFDPAFYEGYQRVNRQFAQQLLPLLQDDDVIWVHDYHLLHLAAELRALGCRQRIGFFLHIPFPPLVALSAVPQHQTLMQALMAFDLVGLQSRQDLAHFESYVLAQADGRSSHRHHYRAHGQQTRCEVFPIGIDAQAFAALTDTPPAQQVQAMMAQEHGQRRLVVGIDRLDYSKGLPERIHAFRDLLERHPEHRRSATLVQIGSPTREHLQAYADLRHQFESLCGAINGDFGELDWMPVRYIHQVLTRAQLAGLCRSAAVGLVTPLRDGMNLVAKEFIAAQDPADPGVLVLSRFAGAAEQLQEALLVNPYDAHCTANSMDQALQMPLAERIDRHQKLLARIQAEDVHWWCQRFLHALDQCQPALQRKPRITVPAHRLVAAADTDLPMTRPTRDGSFPYLRVVAGSGPAQQASAAAVRIGR